MPVHSKYATTSSSTPGPRKQPFTFIRSKLETKLREFQKTVSLNGDIYNRNVTAAALQDALTNNIAVSYSGRTLAEILSLSQPNNLYTVDGISPGYGRIGTVELRREMQSWQSKVDELERKNDELERKIDELERKIDELEGKIGVDAEVLVEWQTASLVICAFGSFAWDLVSEVDKAELVQYKICGFCDLYHARLRPGTARNFAQRIYRKIDQIILGYADNLVSMKGNTTASRKHLAHPPIPNDRLLKFLARLGSDHAELEPLEVDMFRFLKLVSNTEENIERTARRG